MIPLTVTKFIMCCLFEIYFIIVTEKYQVQVHHMRQLKEFFQSIAWEVGGGGGVLILIFIVLPSDTRFIIWAIFEKYDAIGLNNIKSKRTICSK